MGSRNNISYFQTLVRTIQVVFHSAPIEVSVSILISFISGIGPALTLILTKNIVDDLSKFTLSRPEASSIANNIEIDRVYLLLIIMLLINICSDSLLPFGNIIYPNIEDKVQGTVKKILIKKVSDFKDILIFESPKTLDLLKLAEKGIGNLSQLVSTLSTILDGILGFIPSVFSAIIITWWIPFLVIFTSIPFVFIESKYRIQSWSIEEVQAEAIRQLDIYFNMLISEAFSKEIRILSLQNLLLEKWSNLYMATHEKMYKIRLKGAFLTLFSSFFEGLGFAIPYCVIVYGIVHRNHTIGDLVLFSGLILPIRWSLRASLGSSSQLLSGILSVRPIFQFLDLEPCLSCENSDRASDTVNLNGCIQVKGLKFAYPNSNQLAIKNINFSIFPGQTIVLVGENGSGKSTIAKLICRFYDPMSGNIMWNGQDIKSLSIDELRANIAVVFQDFARFPASIRENVGWANLEKLDDTIFLENVLRKTKLLKIFKDEKGIDTVLTKLFEGGTELSGGQWQRIAIARALTRIQNVKLLILDEPTAAIDPDNEHEIYNLIREMSADCMTLIISHRLGMARSADRIIVLDDGMIIEEGTHEELMFKSGKYKDMFTKQMSQYV